MLETFEDISHTPVPNYNVIEYFESQSFDKTFVPHGTQKTHAQKSCKFMIWIENKSL